MLSEPDDLFEPDEFEDPGDGVPDDDELGFDVCGAVVEDDPPIEFVIHKLHLHIEIASISLVFFFADIFRRYLQDAIKSCGV